MGISSFKEDLNTRIDQIRWDKLGDLADKPEKERVQHEAMVETTFPGGVMRDLHALFPPGDSSTDQPKKSDTERNEEVISRLFGFMKGGACKESFTDFADCIEREERSSTCLEKMPKLIKCVVAHSDYYQPIISLAESAMERIDKEEHANMMHANRMHYISRIFS